MSRLIRLREAVIVEGKYDKITLGNIIDATIIPTNGFSIFKDKDKCDLIRRIAQKNGIVVITDSDSAGALIRAHLKNICAGAKITNVYMPQLAGKEKRKAKPSKQGLLGVEGLSPDIIRQALSRSGITEDSQCKTQQRVITKADFYALGLSGGTDSSALRERLADFLELPKGMSSSAFLDAVNAVYGAEEFIKAVELWRQEEDKR